MIGVLGYRKASAPIGGDPHVHYYNRHFGFSIRPARAGTPITIPTRPACTTSASGSRTRRAVDQAARELDAAGVAATPPRYYPEYDRDYYATFFDRRRRRPSRDHQLPRAVAASAWPNGTRSAERSASRFGASATSMFDAPARY